MVLEIKQEPKLTQQLLLTPQLQLAIKLLQLNRLELENAIREELNQNPLLEEEPREEEEEVLWDSLIGWGKKASRKKDPFEEGKPWEEEVRVKIGLREHLLWQLRMSFLDEEGMRIGDFLIGNLDDDGYLRISIEEASEILGVSVEKVKEVLEVIQTFDPPGIGARDLKECLLIQLRQKEEIDPLFIRIVEEGFEEILKGNLSTLSSRFNVSKEKLQELLKLLKTLETKPGREFFEVSTLYVIPDLIIYKKDDNYEVILNEEGLPRLRVNKEYIRKFEGKEDPTLINYLKQKLKEAQWFLRGLEQRQKTLGKIGRSIVKFQRDFLEKGIQYLKPLVLKDVALDTGLHESTVSRAIAGKYALTPQGLFELKFFFSSKVGDGLVEMSSRQVKKLIEDLIAQESPSSPLSDQEIAKILKRNYGLSIARRTITKYREALGIPSSKERRREL